MRQQATIKTARYVYVVEDAKGIVYTAHKDENEAREDGELMMDFAKQNGMDADFYMTQRTLH